MKFRSLLCLVLCMCLMVGCGTASNSGTENPKESEKPIDKEIEITIPASFYEGGMTDEQLQSVKEENGFIDAKINEDGSVTYVMLESVHKEYLVELKEGLRESCDELVGEIETISTIEYNEDLTKITITTSSESVSIEEAFIAIGLMPLSGIYQIFAGAEEANVQIEYVNETSGEVIHSVNSEDLK